jgi:hypothetical protein
MLMPPEYPSPRKWHVLNEEGEFIRAFWTKKGVEKFVQMKKNGLL